MDIVHGIATLKIIKYVQEMLKMKIMILMKLSITKSSNKMEISGKLISVQNVPIDTK